MAGFMQPIVLRVPSYGRQHAHQGFYGQSPLDWLVSDILGDLVYGGDSSSVMAPTTRRPWIHVLDMTGFESDDIDVNVEGSNAIVHAKHEQADGENFDRIERRRAVKIPDGVNKDKLSCLLNRDGKFVMKAPFKQREEDKAKGKELKAKEEEESESAEVVELDGVKNFRIKLNLEDFPAENTSIRFQGDKVFVDAKLEKEEEGLYRCQEVHRQFQLPENAKDEAPKAVMGDNGVLTITVPLKEEAEALPEAEVKQIEIEQKTETESK